MIRLVRRVSTEEVCKVEVTKEMARAFREKYKDWYTDGGWCAGDADEDTLKWAFTDKFNPAAKRITLKSKVDGRLSLTLEDMIFDFILDNLKDQEFSSVNNSEVYTFEKQ